MNHLRLLYFGSWSELGLGLGGELEYPTANSYAASSHPTQDPTQDPSFYQFFRTRHKDTPIGLIHLAAILVPSWL